MHNLSGGSENRAELDPGLEARLDELCQTGWALFERFEAEVREHHFHPFVAADYEVVRRSLVAHRTAGARFLEWGSATGVITIMADLLGFEACGIELDGRLASQARELATRFNSGAKFATGSFVPDGYRWTTSDGDSRTGTLGSGPSGYLQLGHPLDSFDIVFGYPWGGEAPVMMDVMAKYGKRDALLLLYDTNAGVRGFVRGREVTPGASSRLPGG